MESPTRKPLRLWPGVVAAIVQLLLRFVAPLILPDDVLIAVFGGLICTVAIVLWWLFFSRAAWLERLGALGLMVAGIFITSRFLDRSLATGAQGFLFSFLAIPVLGLVLVAWAVATQHLSD